MCIFQWDENDSNPISRGIVFFFYIKKKSQILGVKIAGLGTLFVI